MKTAESIREVLEAFVAGHTIWYDENVSWQIDRVNADKLFPEIEEFDIKQRYWKIQSKDE